MGSTGGNNVDHPNGPLFVQALEDALQIEGLEIREIPLSPNCLWELVGEVKGNGTMQETERDIK